MKGQTETPLPKMKTIISELTIGEFAYLHPGCLIDPADPQDMEGYLWAAFREDKEENLLNSILMSGENKVLD